REDLLHGSSAIPSAATTEHSKMVMDAKTHNSNPPPGGGWVSPGSPGGGCDIKSAVGAASAAEGNGFLIGGVDCLPRKMQANYSKLVQAPDGGWGWCVLIAN
ncbi:unnamed protein product, partial [Meganyctiphanes norvegica]